MIFVVVFLQIWSVYICLFVGFMRLNCKPKSEIELLWFLLAIQFQLSLDGNPTLLDLLLSFLETWILWYTLMMFRGIHLTVFVGTKERVNPFTFPYFSYDPMFAPMSMPFTFCSDRDCSFHIWFSTAGLTGETPTPLWMLLYAESQAFFNQSIDWAGFSPCEASEYRNFHICNFPILHFAGCSAVFFFLPLSGEVRFGGLSLGPTRAKLVARIAQLELGVSGKNSSAFSEKKIQFFNIFHVKGCSH